MRFVAVPLFIFPVGLFAQAGIEYALKSGGTLNGYADGPAAIAGCRVDSVLTCLSDSYPQAAVAVGSVMVILVLRWMTRIFEGDIPR